MASEYARKRKWEVYRERFAQIFWSRVDRREGECWPYRGSRRGNGYGRLRVYGKYELAHRVAFGLANGPIPAGMMVCHHCDNPPCCNPGHLFLGTARDNAADKSAKRRQPSGERAPAAKLTGEQVSKIRERISVGELPWHIAKDYGVHPTAIYRIRDGRTWNTALKARSAP